MGVCIDRQCVPTRILFGSEPSRAASPLFRPDHKPKSGPRALKWIGMTLGISIPTPNRFRHLEGLDRWEATLVPSEWPLFERVLRIALGIKSSMVSADSHRLRGKRLLLSAAGAATRIHAHKPCTNRTAQTTRCQNRVGDPAVVSSTLLPKSGRLSTTLLPILCPMWPEVSTTLLPKRGVSAGLLPKCQQL